MENSVYTDVSALRKPGRWWRFAVAACIAVALSGGVFSCGSDGGTQDQGQDQEEAETDVDSSSGGKYDAAGYPSGLYVRDDLSMVTTPGELLMLNLKPDKTFVLEMGIKSTCPEGAYCIMPPPGANAPVSYEGMYKFTKTPTKKYVSLYIGKKLLYKFEYKQDVTLTNLQLRNYKKKDVWITVIRQASESECYRTADCMPGEECEGNSGGCPRGAYCILPVTLTGHCKPQPCGGGCESWEVCQEGNDCPAGAYCIVSIPDRCVPKGCGATGAPENECGDDAYCKMATCPEGAYCIMPPPGVPRGHCEPNPPDPCPDGAYCIIPHIQPIVANYNQHTMNEPAENDDWTRAAEMALGRV